MQEQKSKNREYYLRTAFLFAVLSVLPLLHLWFCFYAFHAFENGWGGVLVTGVDFPFSILILTLLPPLEDLFHLHCNTLVLFAIFGTLWWYFLEWVAISIGRWVIRRSS